ncbi:two-component system sensor histidine kinase DcuS [Paenibacillus albidus]|uniref:histidine kinase n=1 Tax=Paenibacillus albidus TaxID=2041023 RepID=A0A917FSD1_9BACL|nr:DcuS/MalK family sensor histidine kinase [Paenibacillus albidus]GGF99387.1 two-component system sensor histidine kinase DcuS [Paenibacillus albidus]
MKIGKMRLRLQATITVMICLVVTLVLLIVFIMFGIKVSEQAEEALESKAITIARTLSRTPVVIDGLLGNGDSGGIQDYASEISTINNVEFIVVMDMQGIRRSHPDPALIGKHFMGGDETDALHGKETLSVAEGSLGYSVRAFSPIFGSEGKVIGAVAVGISLGSVQSAVKQNQWIIYWGILVGGLMGITGAVLLARKIKRMIFGMEPGEIAKLLEERNAMLQSTKEGILAVDKESRITLVNAEARRLMGSVGMNQDPVNRQIEQFWPLLRMDRVLGNGKALQDMEVEQSGITLLVNVVPVKVNGIIEGAIATFRDKTEISLLMERLSGISLYAEALRAQTHEFMNKLHVIMGLTNMRSYDRLEEYLTDTVLNIQTEADAVVKLVKDPIMVGFLLGKLSRIREAGVRLVILEDGVLPESANHEVSRELVTIVGNLLDNALEAVDGVSDKMIQIGFRHAESQLTLKVGDNGTGISKECEDRMYEQGYSTKGKDRGIGLYLVGRSLAKLGGTIRWESRAGEGTEFTVQLPYIAKSDK